MEVTDENEFLWLDKIMQESADNLNSKQVLEWINRLQYEKDKFENDAVHAKTRYLADMDQVNLRSFKNLEFSVKQRGRLIGMLQVKLGEIKRIEKSDRVKASFERDKLFERQFFYNAHKILPRDLYELVLSKTREQIDEVYSLPATSSASSS